MTAQHTDILVAGGGVAGLIATITLARTGAQVTCVDPVPPVTDIAAEGADLRSTAFLQPSVALLRSAGLWDRLAPHAQPLETMRIADAGGPVCAVRELADFRASELGHEAFGYNLPNWLLRREFMAVIGDMAGVDFVAPCKVERITPRTSGPIVHLDDGRALRPELLVAADGRGSLIRRSLGIGVKTRTFGQKALVFNVSHPRPHENVSTEIHRAGGPFTLVPLPDDSDGTHRSAVVWMDRGPEIQRLAALDTAAFEAALNERACDMLGHLTVISRKVAWPIIAQTAERMTGPATVLMAEAAHVVPPIGAQGLNMSLADLSALRDMVIRARTDGRPLGDPVLLAEYEKTRARDVALRTTGVDLLNSASIMSAPALRDLRRQGLRALSGMAPVRKLAMQAGLGMGRGDGA
ncbi:FAD-dependent monooxygenase [Oceanomicrobium pacificus]|uniref:FAD-binding protein n=1 Tax=Oceanomicrobium pacificus TaxID=2692916 RepID=A0A6B0TY97_9RHOB|nr:FAD-dependent monooxygenase [Oceanomicrobium pacificus]MXU65973.1 FAD-binding protein [Oceanomicrobium pacificus]